MFRMTSRFVCALLLGNLFITGNVAAELPNIVIIMADDMGYGDVRANNPDSKIPTPAIDSLASAGMTFTDAHTPSAVCTPTRYGLVTGRYCWRSRLKRGVLNGYSEPLIERDRPTIASVLKSRGYKTGIVGKWHLGLGFAKKAGTNELDFTVPVNHGPNDLGFDYSYIIPASLDFPPYVYLKNGQVTDSTTVNQPAQKFPAFLRNGPRSQALVMEDCIDNLLEHATSFIRREAKTESPFLLYVPLSAPHKPVLPHGRFKGKTDLGPYGDFVVQVDWTVGQVLKSIDDAGVRDNTIVIYTSDNGSFMHRRDSADAADHVSDETIQAYRADHHRANGPFRGTKADVWEAGHHVPFFVRWPRRVKPASKSAETICLTDLLATMADITGAKIPEGAAEDSFSMTAALECCKRPTPRPPVINHSANGMFAIRSGPWKLVLGNGSGGREAPRGKPFAKPYHLLNLDDDIAEANNLIEQRPEMAAEMEKSFYKIYRQGN